MLAMVAAIRGLTQSAFFAFGRALLDFYWCTVFPRGARKNRTQMIEEYHAAAGRRYFNCGHRVTPNNQKEQRVKINEIQSWLQERAPANLLAEPPEIAIYDDEVVIVLPVATTELDDQLTD